METSKYISITAFCQGHSLEESFLFRMEEFALIQILEIRQESYFLREDLPRVERLVRLHKDFQISPQGLQAVDHLLERMRQMQEEMDVLRRRLDQWERTD